MTQIRIHLAPEHLTEGTPEEKAAFGLVTFLADGRSLTQGYDTFIDGPREGPLVSGYHLAEWLAWNWWRLKCEPRPPSPPGHSWQFAHALNTIGEGYVWPNLTIHSDGFRAVLESRRSVNDHTVFRYFGAMPVLAQWSDVEAAIDHFVGVVLSRLDGATVRASNLHTVWEELRVERANPELARYRALEAKLGYDPGEADEAILNARLAEARTLGDEAMGELASLAAMGAPDAAQLMTADELRALARQKGQSMNARDGVSLAPAGSLPWGTCPAHEIGVELAHWVRAQTDAGDGQIGDRELVALAGAQLSILTPERTRGPLSFGLLDEGGMATAILSGTRTENRRFELARLIGDRIMRHEGSLFPVTDARTYRQKAQRAFAAELLAPIAAVKGMAGGDFSEDRQEEIAEHFRVSPMVINRLLKNNRVIDRDPFDYLDVA
ncbi:ImmA/IrrE family metallo-endopeptidase [Rhodocista pekingensis]|uniref:ImmA/IrrE family metallo-endopeptidase n=1 Tax=Rhodocista pekingensis TaxID=201185 RepID=A0ABW2KWC6_9PROT